MLFSMELFLSVAALLMLLSVFASKLSDKFSVPALLLFIAIGMAAGSEGLGGIYFDNYQLSKTVGIVALIFIIFSGGLDTSWRVIKPLALPGAILSTAGVFITALVVGFFAVWLLKFSPVEGLLLGAVVSSTDAAAVFGVLRSRKISLKGGLKPLLELESGSNDPMAVFLTISLLSILSGQSPDMAGMVSLFIMNMSIGLAFGYVMAKVTVFAIKKISLEYDGLYPVMTISIVLLTYSMASLFKGNGFLAVYILGLLVSRHDFINKHSLIRFHEGVAWLMQIVMFLTLGLLVFPSEIVPVVKSGFIIAFVLIFLARPVSIFFCLAPFRFTFKEKLMISWVGLRGAVPIVLATFPLLAGISRSHAIFNIVFFVVLTSILIQGTSIPFAARFLKVDSPLRHRRRFPIEFDRTEGIDAALEDVIVPYNSSVAGKALRELAIPERALVVLVSRGEKFIVPGGSTVIEEGDVMLVLANAGDLKRLQSAVSVLNKTLGSDLENRK